MLLTLIAVFHMSLMVLLSLYVFWGKKEWDMYFIIVFLLMNLGWSVFKNECIVSYGYKILQNPKNEMGDRPLHVPDLERFLGKDGLQMFEIYLGVMYVVNVLAIINRQSGWFRVTKAIIVIALISSILYLSVSVTNKEKLRYANLLASSCGLIAIIL